MRQRAADRTGAEPVRIDREFMFTNPKSAYKRGIEKRQRKLLAKIPFINAFLAPDEKVLLVTTCCSPTPILEQLTTGWIVFYLNRALLVITDRRILHVPTKMSYAYRGSIAQIHYADCEDIAVRGRHLIVRYRGGGKERFLFVAGRERRKLKPYFKALRGRTAGAQVQPGAQPATRTHLCPRCTRPLTPSVFECRQCRLAFKDMGTALRLSIALPGGGYFYTGHPFLGLGDLVVEGVLLVYLIMMVAAGVTGGVEGAWVAAVLVGAVLAIEKLITVYHARRYINEYIPKEQPVTPQPVAA